MRLFTLFWRTDGRSLSHPGIPRRMVGMLATWFPATSSTVVESSWRSAYRMSARPTTCCHRDQPVSTGQTTSYLQAPSGHKRTDSALVQSSQRRDGNVLTPIATDRDW